MRNGIMRSLCCSAFASFFTFVLPMVALSQSVAVSTDQLVRQSDLIVVGKVGKMSAQWTKDKRMIVTRVEINVDQAIKGQPQGGKVEVLVPGGELDGIGEWYSHTPRFSDQEEIVLFAEQAGQGRLRVAGGEEGKIAVVRDKTTGKPMIPNFGALSEFTSKLEATVELQKNEILKTPH